MSKVQFGFFIDTTKCTGCKTCHVACKDANSRLAAGSVLPGDAPNKRMPIDGKWRRVYELGGGQMGQNADGTFSAANSVFAYYVSIGCNHCAQPTCVEACPTGACHKRPQDGLVHINQADCIGCESCSAVCPYDAPQYDAERGVMSKCDGCYGHIDLDLTIPLEKRRKPHCVEACPLRAIDFGEIKELRAKYGTNADIQGLPDSSETQPSLVIKLGSAAKKGQPRLLNSFEV